MQLSNRGSWEETQLMASNTPTKRLRWSPQNTLPIWWANPKKTSTRCRRRYKIPVATAIMQLRPAIIGMRNISLDRSAKLLKKMNARAEKWRWFNKYKLRRNCKRKWRRVISNSGWLTRSKIKDSMKKYLRWRRRSKVMATNSVLLPAI